MLQSRLLLRRRSLCLPDAALLSRARAYEIEVASPSVSPDSNPPLTSVLGDPAETHDPAYLGHMLNDGAICPTEALRMTYVSESTRARNVEPVQLEGCHLAIVATRDLRRGEELVITYGAPYWLAQLGGVQRSDAAPNDADEGDGGERHGGGRRRRQGRQQRRGGSVHLDEEDEWLDCCTLALLHDGAVARGDYECVALVERQRSCSTRLVATVWMLLGDVYM